MRTYNKGNTQNVKQARKQSKELRKLKSNRNTLVETSESHNGQQEIYHCEKMMFMKESVYYEILQTS